MGKSCKDVAQSLVECTKKTKCVKNGGSIRDCIKENTEGDCQEFLTAYYLCKRGSLDMRTRIQGPKY
jgi:hypothetical protein